MVRTAKKLMHRLGRATQAVSANTHTSYHECPHCSQTTPWVVQALRGYYRCTRCGRNPLEG